MAKMNILSVQKGKKPGEISLVTIGVLGCALTDQVRTSPGARTTLHVVPVTLHPLTTPNVKDQNAGLLSAENCMCFQLP